MVVLDPALPLHSLKSVPLFLIDFFVPHALLYRFLESVQGRLHRDASQRQPDLRTWQQAPHDWHVAKEKNYNHDRPDQCLNIAENDARDVHLMPPFVTPMQ